MSTMTGLGRYQVGLSLEEEGYSAAEIARRCGYKDAQAWQSSKHYYRKREQALNERARAKADELPQPAPILEGLNLARRAVKAADPTPTTPKAAKAVKPAEKPPSALKIQMQLQASGVAADYKLEGGKIWIRKRGRQKAAYTPFTALEASHLIVELGELLKRMEGLPHD